MDDSYSISIDLGVVIEHMQWMIHIVSLSMPFLFNY
uniref:Uncharacterized protein n=1 Tax=Arundo donax TaxID=35708 RepID=A0A0A8YHP7_ARUDO